MRRSRYPSAIASALLLGACATAGSRTGAAASGTAASTGDSAAIARAMDAMNSPFVGSTKSRKFYPVACSTVKSIKPADQIGFASPKEAESAGYTKDVSATDCVY